MNNNIQNTMNKPNNTNDNSDTLLKGIGIVAGAAVLIGAMSKGADAYNTHRKYNAIDNAVDGVLGLAPKLLGSLFK